MDGTTAAVADCNGWLAGVVVADVVAVAGAGVAVAGVGVFTVAERTFAVTFGAPAELGVDPVGVAAGTLAAGAGARDALVAGFGADGDDATTGVVDTAAFVDNAGA